MVLQLFGTKKNIKLGVQYLRDQGVDVKNAAHEISRDDKKCFQCGACTAVCPTGAIYIQRPEMIVHFDQSKCSLCESCINACSARAFVVRAKSSVFFE